MAIREDSIVKNLFKKIYLGNSITIITVCWIVFSLHLTMIYQCENCINLYDEQNTFTYILYLSLGIIFIVYIPIIIYFFINRKTIGKEKDYSIEQDNGNFGFANSNPIVFILPMYLLWIFSLSKLIVIFYSYVISEITDDFFLKLTILLIIFIGSFWAWFSFKKTSTKYWSLWVTIFAISYVLINIYWEEFFPFLQSYFSTWNCILKSFIKS